MEEIDLAGLLEACSRSEEASASLRSLRKVGASAIRPQVGVEMSRSSARMLEALLKAKTFG